MRCPNCNADVPQTAEWCNQCLQPMPTANADTGGPGGPGTPTEGPEEWVLTPPEYSAIRKGPYSFGLGGKLVITAIIVGLGVGLFFLARFITTYLEVPGMGIVLLFLIPYTIIALIFLWGTWRPTRVK